MVLNEGWSLSRAAVIFHRSLHCSRTSKFGLSTRNLTAQTNAWRIWCLYVRTFFLCISCCCRSFSSTASIAPFIAVRTLCNSIKAREKAVQLQPALGKAAKQLHHKCKDATGQFWKSLEDCIRSQGLALLSFSLGESIPKDWTSEVHWLIMKHILVCFKQSKTNTDLHCQSYSKKCPVS